MEFFKKIEEIETYDKCLEYKPALGPATNWLTQIWTAIYPRRSTCKLCLHYNHLYFVAYRRRFAVIKMIAVDYTIALARAARLIHLVS